MKSQFSGLGDLPVIISFLGLAFLYLQFESKIFSLKRPTDLLEKHSAFCAFLMCFEA